MFFDVRGRALHGRVHVPALAGHPYRTTTMRAPRGLLAAAWILLYPATLVAETVERARDTGVSAVWVLANLCYAGMRAQNSSNTLGRVLAFLFGLPGTLLTWLVVREGSERAYGVDLPRVANRIG